MTKVEAAGIEPASSVDLTCCRHCGCVGDGILGAVYALQTGDNESQRLASFDPRLQRLVDMWPGLSEEVRTAITSHLES